MGPEQRAGSFSTVPNYDNDDEAWSVDDIVELQVEVGMPGMGFSRGSRPPGCPQGVPVEVGASGMGFSRGSWHRGVPRASSGCPQGVPRLIPPVHPTLNSRCDVVPGSPDAVFPGSRSSRRCTPTAATTSPSSPWIPSPARRAGSPSSSPPETSGELGGKPGILPQKTPGILGIFSQKHPRILIFPGGKIQEFCLKNTPGC